MIKRLLLVTALTLTVSFAAFAQGACPTAAYYVNPALGGVAGPKVTLASLGVTGCYFIAANGSDSNSGICEVVTGTSPCTTGNGPWQHAPFMRNCTATCATVQAGLTSTSALGFIFRGGDTWHVFTGSPQIGLPPGWPNGSSCSGGVCNGWDWNKSGTAANPFYIGVDFGWSVSSPWTRPIINNDNPVNPTPGYLPVAGLPQFYFNSTSHTITLNGIVASCAFPQGALNDLDLDAVEYVYFDNFEFTGICGNDQTTNSNPHQYIKHAGPPPQTSELSGIYNVYMHGWTHTPFVEGGLSNAGMAVNALGSGYTTSSQVAVNNMTLLGIVQITQVNGSGGVIEFNVLYGGTGVSTGTRSTTTVSGPGSGLTFTVSSTVSTSTAFGGGIQGDSHADVGNQILYNVCDGSDSDDTMFSCLGVDTSAGNTAYNVFRHFGGTQIIDNCHTLHDNLFEYVNNSTDSISHGDVYFCIGEQASDNFFYDNLLRYIGTEYGIPLSVIIWFNNQNTSPTTTDYVFNNVEHDLNQCGNFNNFEAGVAGSKFQIFNNTIQSMNSTPVNTCSPWENGANPGSAFAGTITEGNNHYITGTNTGTTCAWAFSFPPPVNGGGACPDTFMTMAAANAAGYTSANDYAATSPASPTVGAGANETSISGPFGPAFLQTTTNGCVESFVNTGFGSPTVVCPNLMPTNRPTTGACPGVGCWNSGAYNFISPTVALAPTPYSFAATVLGANSSDSPVTFTLTNNSGVMITGVTISFTGSNPGDFTETTSCVATLASSASCQVFVTFTPTAIGSRTAILSVADSGASSPQTSSLSGTAIPSAINPSPANPVTFGVVVTDPSIPSTVKNEKHSANLSAYNF